MRFFSARCYAACIAVYALVAASTVSTIAYADELPAAVSGATRGTEELTLSRAIEVAWTRNPQLRAAQAAVVAGGARVDTAALRPPLELTADAENVLGTGDLSGFSGSEITVGVAQVFELGRKRAERIGVAQVERRVLESEREWLRLDIQADVTDTFVQALALEQRIAIVERARGLADSIVAAAGRRVTAGASSEAELSRARVAVAQTRIESLTLATQRAALQRDLARFMGRESPAGGFRLAGSLDPLPGVPPPSVLVALLASAPDSQRAALGREVARARLALADAQRRPDVSLAGGVRNLAATNDVALVFRGAVPLGAARRAGSGIAESRAELERADALAESSSQTLVTQAQSLADALDLAQRELEILRTTVVPESQRAETLLTRGYELGRFSYLEVADAQRQSIDASRALVELTLGYHQTLLALGRLLGRFQPAEGLSP
ncbi:MAG: TolC family protein [Gammaproteobacteria bacterium]